MRLATGGNGHPPSIAERDGADDGYAGPDSVTWRLACEYVLLLGAGRAVLMQLAHPLVAEGVFQHSNFLSDPVGRSYRTVEFTQILAFGSRDEVHAIARHVNRLHHHVTGALGEEAGQYNSETPYRAQDPALLLWVYATLVDSAIAIYPLLVGPISRAEERRYYEETKRTAVLLGVPRVMLPTTLEDFEAYVHATLSGSALVVTPAARVLSRQLLALPLPRALRFAQPLAHYLATQITIGFMQPRLRALYGYSWGPGRQRLFTLGTTTTRRLLPLAPLRLRYTPWARRALARSHSHEVGGAKNF
jgi:uncharacterized protein (DUF2236 family)